MLHVKVPRMSTLMPSPPTIVVSKPRRGQSTSRADALRAAPAGARIVVQPGIYNEALVLDRFVEIAGDGKPADIVVQSAESCCLTMRTDQAIVRGLTLRGRGATR